MKKIFNLVIATLLLVTYSCNDNADYNTDDFMTGTAVEGGSILAVKAGTEGKVLGVPSSQDFENATISFAEVGLDMEVIFMSGGKDVDSYQIVKTLNGGEEVVVATSEMLPISAAYETIDEYVDGLGVTPEDLRIGDVISFKTKIIKTDGAEFYSNDGTYNVTVSCSSNLAQEYSVALHYIRTSTGDDTWYYFNDVITATGVGEYRTTEVGPWIGGLGVGVPGYTLVDLCGSITIPEQNLVDYYSNIVLGSGTVDGDTGVITIEYTICADDCRECYAVYTPIN